MPGALVCDVSLQFWHTQVINLMPLGVNILRLKFATGRFLQNVISTNSPVDRHLKYIV